jgi:hypothetical protein
MLKDFQGYIKNFQGQPINYSSYSAGVVLLTSDIGQVYYNLKINDLPKLANNCDLVSFRIPKRFRNRLNWIDLETETRSTNLNKLSLELLQFLRRYGVRVK